MTGKEAAHDFMLTVLTAGERERETERESVSSVFLSRNCTESRVVHKNKKLHAVYIQNDF